MQRITLMENSNYLFSSFCFGIELFEVFFVREAIECLAFHYAYHIMYAK